MKIHILSIFPEAFSSFSQSSMIAKAQKNNAVELCQYKLSDFSDKNFWHVDDKAYGMHGQVISPEPLWKAIEHIFTKAWKNMLVIYMTPSGELLQQEKLESYYSEITEKWSEFLIICGHYEWIDQRIIDLYVNIEISIWEYVLTSWELAAQVLIDGLIRFVPWVLWNVKSLDEDSFSKILNRQKEYPVYTRPRIYQDKKVPDILLSGDPKKIEVWKQQHLR